MVIQREEPIQVLAKRRVLYIGSAVPLESSEGLEAVQQPLRDRYPAGEGGKIQGIDSWLSVLNTGLQIQYVEDPDTIVFFSITNLTLCAAVRPVNAINAPTGEVMPKFVSLNSDLAAQNAKNPAIFTAITRREKGRRVLECHGFVCATDQDALEIVKATSVSDQNKRRNGTVRTGPGSYRVNNGVPNRSRPGSYRVNGTVPSVVNGRPLSARENVRLSAGEQFQSHVDDVPQEFYDSPPPQGYFYRPNNVQAKNFTIQKQGPPLSARSGYVQPAEPPAPPPPPPQPVPAEPAPVPQPPKPTTPEPVSQPTQTEPEINGTQDRRPPPPPQENGVPPPFQRFYMPRGPGGMYYPPPPYARPYYYPPPPPMARPRFFSPPPYMRGAPYPYPYPYGPPPPFVRRRRSKRRESESPAGSKSSGSRRSSPRSPRDSDETARKRVPNADIDTDSDDISVRPRTPPRDYDRMNGEAGPYRKERVSRKEDYDRRKKRGKRDRSDKSPPRMMYSGYRPYYMYQPQAFNPYMPNEDGRFQRSSSVPPHLRYSQKDRKTDKKKNKKKDKGKNKQQRGLGGYGQSNYFPPYGQENISMDSNSMMGGYASEIPQGVYPMDGYSFYQRPPRDFRREKNQFLNEKSFSRRMQEEQRKSKGRKEDYYPTAYELNDAQAEERLNEPDFTMY